MGLEEMHLVASNLVENGSKEEINDFIEENFQYMRVISVWSAVESKWFEGLLADTKDGERVPPDMILYHNLIKLLHLGREHV